MHTQERTGATDIPPTGTGGDMRVVRLWDPVVRLIHWGLALLIPCAWWVAERRDIAMHVYLGYAILFLLVYRIYWGLFGSETARFGAFLSNPGAITAYAKGLFNRQSPPSLGHNPLGALSAILILAALCLQVLLGLFATDIDGLESGPLSYLIDFDLSRDLAEWHGFTFNILLTLIVLHIAAIGFYLGYKRQDLVTPMLTGRRSLPAVIARQPKAASLPNALAGAILSAALVWAVANAG